MNEPSAIHIIFDGPPSHDAPRFIEVENPEGQSIRIGEWEPDPRPEYAGQWRLRITLADMLAESGRQRGNEDVLDGYTGEPNEEG